MSGEWRPSFDITVKVTEDKADRTIKSETKRVTQEERRRKGAGGIYTPTGDDDALPKSVIARIEKEAVTRVQQAVGDEIKRDSDLLGEQGSPAEQFKQLKKEQKKQELAAARREKAVLKDFNQFARTIKAEIRQQEREAERERKRLQREADESYDVPFGIEGGLVHGHGVPYSQRRRYKTPRKRTKRSLPPGGTPSPTIQYDPPDTGFGGGNTLADRYEVALGFERLRTNFKWGMRDDQRRGKAPLDALREAAKQYEIDNRVNLETVQNQVDALEKVLILATRKIGPLVGGGSGAAAEGIAGQGLIRVLSGAGPYGAAAIALITAIVASPEVVKAIVKTLGKKGGPLNRDWRRFIEEEVNGLLSIDAKKRRIFGEDTYIVTSVNRFEPVSGNVVHNSLENRHESIIRRQGHVEKALGVRHP